jgi:hypothetical protein
MRALTRPTHAPDGGSAPDSAWAVLLLSTLLVLALQIGQPFALTLRGLALPLTCVVGLGALAAFYRHLRPDVRLCAMLTALQQMVLFSMIGAFLSYMVAARGGPYWDADFAAWDGALGLDWMSWLRWLDMRPWLAMPLRLAYASLMPQMAALIVILGLTGAIADLRTTILAAMIAGLCAVIVSGFVPAQAAYSYLNLSPADYPNLRPAAAFAHVADLEALRAGTLRSLSVSELEGIITFPSYHGALAIVFGWGFWRVPLRAVRWAGVLLASMTLIATPVDGGHYFVDVLAGAVIALASLWLARRAVRWRAALPAPAAQRPAIAER